MDGWMDGWMDWLNIDWILIEYWLNIDWILIEYWLNIDWMLTLITHSLTASLTHSLTHSHSSFWYRRPVFGTNITTEGLRPVFGTKMWRCTGSVTADREKDLFVKISWLDCYVQCRTQKTPQRFFGHISIESTSLTKLILSLERAHRELSNGVWVHIEIRSRCVDNLKFVYFQASAHREWISWITF
jgi:hypothetical protein